MSSIWKTSPNLEIDLFSTQKIEKNNDMPKLKMIS